MKEEYVNILKRNNVNYFYHFTNIINLNSVLDFGILNRIYMDSNNIKYSKTDEDRSDNQLDCISLSLATANKKMLFNKKLKINTEWVIIELDASKIIENYYDNIYYCKYNASSPSTVKMLNSNKNYMKSYKAFNSIFESDLNINYQSELLLKGNISIDYITKIYVEDLSIKLLVEQIIISKNIKGLSVVIKKEMF